MTEIPLVIEERPKGVKGWFRQLLKGRRLLLAGILALLEVIAIIIWRPGVLIAVIGAILVLSLAVIVAIRIKPGFWRDVLWIVAGAQAMIVTPIVLVGASLLLGILIAGVLIVGIIALALRMKW